MKTEIEVGRNDAVREAVVNKLQRLGYTILPCSEKRFYLWIYQDGLCIWANSSSNPKSPI